MSNGWIEKKNYKTYRGWLKFYGLHVGGIKKCFNRSSRRINKRILRQTFSPYRPLQLHVSLHEERMAQYE